MCFHTDYRPQYIPKMNKLLPLCLLLLLSEPCWSQGCSPSRHETDLIDTGRLAVTRTGSTREHCYSVPIRYSMPVSTRGPDIAISVARIEGLSTGRGFDFGVSAGRKGISNSIAVTLHINQDNSWTALELSYMVSSRTDLVLGSFMGSLFQTSSCSAFEGAATPSIALQTYIPLWRLNNSTTYRVMAFVSGFRTADNEFILRVNAAELDRSDGRIVVQVQSIAAPSVEYVYITYVVYPLVLGGFDISVAGVGVPSTYGLVGITGVNQRQGMQYGQFSLCRRDANLPACSQNQTLINQRCECRTGFVRVNGQCFALCGLNAYTTPSRQCLCLPGFTRNSQSQCTNTTASTPVRCRQNEVLLTNNTCACRPGFYRSNINTCLPICFLANQIWNGSECVCGAGFVRGANGVCLQRVTCQVYEVEANGGCVCQGGYERNPAGQCVKEIRCDKNQVVIQGECRCQPGWGKNPGGVCKKVEICQGLNQSFSLATGKCQCENGFIRVGHLCVSRCGINAQWADDKCVCISGHAYVNFACRPCPSSSRPSEDRTTCLCEGGRVLRTTGEIACVCPANSALQGGQCICAAGLAWNQDRTACNQSQQQLCQPNSSRNVQGVCICNTGFILSSDNRTCTQAIKCPENSFVNTQGTCTCLNGLYLDNNACRAIPTCPTNSIWDQQHLQCRCVTVGQNLINGTCRACEENSFWNGSTCICNTNFFRIAGSCQPCHSASTYNGTDCVCNLGFYGTRLQCNRCHSSCSRCTGPEANQCLSCADITYTFANGFCTKNTPCPIGTYLNGGSCSKCSDYCKSCAAELECLQCAVGFQLKLQIIESLPYTLCESICGDGKKNDLQQCDDTNLKNGDGCSSNCTVEAGWTCLNGTSARPSICSPFIPDSVRIEVKGAVNLIGRVVQGVRLSYIPRCFTDRDCVDCFRILDVRVVEGSVPTLVKVSYVPNSDGQFIVEYQFGGVITSTLFKTQIQLNRNLPQNYRECFSPEDFDQQIVMKVDTALLAVADKNRELTLEDLQDNTSTSKPQNISADTLRKIFS